MVDIHDFIDNYRKAFGRAELPIALWYSDSKVAEPEKSNGCFIKCLRKVRDGVAVSFDEEHITCRGGKIYAGYIDMPEATVNFVSGTERYKQTPEMVREFFLDLHRPEATAPYLNFARIDTMESLERAEGLIFFATPDVLSGLVAWAQFDTNAADAVAVPFGSGCSSMISQVVVENRKKGHRVFIGLFDPSVRPHVEANVLGFAVPLSRFREMCLTMPATFLLESRAWDKVRSRINE